MTHLVGVFSNMKASSIEFCVVAAMSYFHVLTIVSHNIDFNKYCFVESTCAAKVI